VSFTARAVKLSSQLRLVSEHSLIYAGGMSPRATPLAPADRREALVEATLPLLRTHGRAVTTRQIAEAAGVAEGTIFRVFESKEELVEAALSRAFEPGRFVEELAGIDAALPFRDRMVVLTTLLQRRFTEIFGLMRAVGMVAPPKHRHRAEEHALWRRQADDLMVALIGDDAVRLSIPPAEFVHALRLLTFSASHEEIADGRLLTPERIVSVVLDGCLARSTQEDPRC
jgi:AcrR family transcriptional regulator